MPQTTSRYIPILALLALVVLLIPGPAFGAAPSPARHAVGPTVPPPPSRSLGARAITPKVAAAATASWHNITPNTTTPGPRNRAVFVSDPSDGYVLLFGGYDALGAGWLGDTWTYSAGVWTQLFPPSGPGARSSASAAYDPTLGGVVMFGGYLYYATSPYYNDTWLFKGGNWTSLPSAVSPSVRSEASMAFDPALNELVLFGGTNATSKLNDTWTFGASGWSSVATTVAPPALSAGSMAYDASLASVVQYGGTTGTTSVLGTWTFNGTWTELAGAGQPGGRTLETLTTLPNGTVLLVGGENIAVGNPPVDAWQFVGGNWAVLSAGPGPNSRGSPAVTYDSMDGYPLLFGGRYCANNTCYQSLNDLWALDVLSARLGVFATSGVAPFALSPAAVVLGGALNFDGSSSVAYTWSFGDGTTSTSAQPTHIYSVAGNVTLGLTLRDALGLTLTLSTPVDVSFRLVLAVAPAAGPERTYQFAAIADNATAPVALLWHFGDGATSTAASPTHTYQITGPVTVRLTGTDAVRANGSGQLSFDVAAPLAASLEAPSRASVGASVSFTASASGGAGGYVYTWSFGDGATAGGPSVTHAYSTSGNLPGRLVVQDTNGTDVNYTFTVNVTANPTTPTTSAVFAAGNAPLLVLGTLAAAVAAGAGLGFVVGRLGRRTN